MIGTTLPGSPEQMLRDGNPAAALDRLQEQVRANPQDAKRRIFLFQLLCVRGQWERALNQLEVASSLDPLALAMAQTYGDAVRCEMTRADVFAGRTAPRVFGVPEPWLGMLIESRLLAAAGDSEPSETLRARAFDEADTSSGDIDGRPFTWIADADSRLGPVIEAMIDGRYYWIPYSSVSTIAIEAPADLRDLVWIQARIQFANGGESTALMPTRYPGSESSDDGLIALARKTVWEEQAPRVHYGLGQRMIATDEDEVPLMEIRTISIHG